MKTTVVRGDAEVPPRSLRPWVNAAMKGHLEDKLRAWRAEGLSWERDIPPLVAAELAAWFRKNGEEPQSVSWRVIMTWAHDTYGIE